LNPVPEAVGTPDQRDTETLEKPCHPRTDRQQAIHDYEVAMRETGLRESTIKSRIKVLKRIDRHTDILNPANVTAYIATTKWQENTKQKRVEDLAAFYKFRHITWQIPNFKRIWKLPRIPHETDIDQLIQELQKLRRGSKPAVFVQLEKETGARPGEALALEWADVDFERASVNISPEKNSNPRQLKISRKLVGMLSTLNRSSRFVFRSDSGDALQSLDNFRRTYDDQRSRVALRLDNPRINQITFKSLRHFKATMEYARTKDILHVMRILGHKNIRNTLVYTHLVNFDSDEWTCKVASTVDEMKTLIEQGFDYVADKDDLKLFRKRR